MLDNPQVSIRAAILTDEEDDCDFPAKHLTPGEVAGEPSARGQEGLGSIDRPAPDLRVTCASSPGFFVCKTTGLDWFGDCKYMTHASSRALAGADTQGGD